MTYTKLKTTMTKLFFSQKINNQPDLLSVNKYSLRAALDDWLEKTAWIKPSVKELGMHKADVLRERIDSLKAENVKLHTLNKKLEAENEESRQTIVGMRLALELMVSRKNLTDDPLKKNPTTEELLLNTNSVINALKAHNLVPELLLFSRKHVEELCKTLHETTISEAQSFMGVPVILLEANEAYVIHKNREGVPCRTALL